MSMLFTKKIISLKQGILLISVVILFILCSCDLVRPIVGPGNGSNSPSPPPSAKPDPNPISTFSGFVKVEDKDILVSLGLVAGVESGSLIGMLNLIGIGSWQLDCLVNNQTMNCSGQNKIGTFDMTGQFTDDNYNSYSGNVTYTEGNSSKSGKINLNRN